MQRTGQQRHLPRHDAVVMSVLANLVQLPVRHGRDVVLLKLLQRGIYRRRRVIVIVPERIPLNRHPRPLGRSQRRERPLLRNPRLQGLGHGHGLELGVLLLEPLELLHLLGFEARHQLLDGLALAVVRIFMDFFAFFPCLLRGAGGKCSSLGRRRRRRRRAGCGDARRR